MTDIYVLTARDKSTYSMKPTKLLRAFSSELDATAAKLLIEECEPRLDVEVVAVPLATETTQKPAQAPALKMAAE